MQKIVVLNPKGGSGKSTIATNLAGYFATQGRNPTLMDMDAQGSSMRWLSKRGGEYAPIHGIAAYERNSRVTRSFALRIPQGCECVIVDTAAALEAQSMPEVTRDASAVLVPVLPSDIDIHAAAKCITNLLLVAKIPREDQRIGVIANRVKKNTVMYRALMRFLATLEIPIVTTLRDSQNYVRASESGTGIFEMKPYLVREDLDQWLPLLGWLAQRQGAVAGPTAQAAAARIDAPIATQNVAREAPILESMAPAAIPMPRRPMFGAPKTAPAPPAEAEKPKESTMKTSVTDFLKFVSRDT